MFKKSPLYLAMLAVAGAPMGAMAESSFSAVIKSELAGFVNNNQRTGEASSTLDNSTGDSLMKWETSARLFFNADLTEDISGHLELRPVYESEGIAGANVHKSYSQMDWFREGYLDIPLNDDWDLRAGKQQVVWGTADGIKLLDIINPTDFSELNQNAVEDARIPVFMLNVEGYLPNDMGNLQLVMSEARRNRFSGLDAEGPKADMPFVPLGVDSITGPVNGFLNVAPALAGVASNFTNAANGGLFSRQPNPAGLTNFSGVTVDGFASSTPIFIDPNGDSNFTTNTGFDDDYALLPGGLPDPNGNTFANSTANNDVPPNLAAVLDENGVAGNALSYTSAGFVTLNNIAQFGFTEALSAGAGSFTADPNGNFNVTNLMPVADAPLAGNTAWNPETPVSGFEYMPMATFATFNTFSGPGAAPGAVTAIQTEYVKDLPDFTEPNAGGRFRKSLDNGLNFSVNYFYHYSSNPAVNLSWHDAGTNEELEVVRANAGDFVNNSNATPNPDGLPDFANPNDTVSAADVPTQLTAFTGAGSPVSVLLRNSQNEFYGSFAPAPGTVLATNNAKLRFTETMHRVHSIGSSFDYAMDVGGLPVVLRGEFLYDHGDKQPVINRKLLAIGDISNALTMEEADYFKYVIGVDVTVLTNLLVSGQFIQFRNLDYVDEPASCFTQGDLALGGTAPRTVDCSRYTGDFATLHLTNGLNKGYENKEFYSLFLSKPFGEGQRGRVNNIIIFEEGGGYWDRIDAEYTLTDNLIIGGELNFYWGAQDTMFGQFNNSSNAQVTIKYITN